MERVAVVGAGMAGLACARTLAEAGLAPVLFDKGRAAGGRVATRRRDGLVFNHGAQYATARTPSFRALLDAWKGQNTAAVWPGAGEPGRDDRWTGTPGMSALPRALATGLDVQTERHVLFLHRDAAGWQVRHEAAAVVRPGTVADTGGQLAGPFGTVVVALPAPQAAPLLRTMGHRFAAPVAEVVVDPCWAVMFATDTRLDLPGADGRDLVRFAGDGEPLATVARDSGRPGRPALPECWMLHASPDWSHVHEEDAAEDVAATLLAAFSRRVGAPVHARNLSAHRWRFSQTRSPLRQPFLWDPGAGLGVCGDWCLGARVEDAFTSGRELAGTITA